MDVYGILGASFGLWLFVLAIGIAIQVWCCIVAYRMAEECGQSGGVWVVLSLLVGWIAVIILACIRKPYGYDRNNRYQQNYYQQNRPQSPLTDIAKDADDGVWICEHCGLKNAKTYTYCKGCYKRRK